jgi:hypothetical protein
MDDMVGYAELAKRLGVDLIHAYVGLLTFSFFNSFAL